MLKALGPSRERAWFVGEQRVAEGVDSVLAAGRGFAYGDGVFETMRAFFGVIPWWPGHRARLVLGTARLRIALPSPTASTPNCRLAVAASRRGGEACHHPRQRRACLRAGAGPPPVWMLAVSRAATPARGWSGPAWCETASGAAAVLAGLSTATGWNRSWPAPNGSTPTSTKAELDTGGDVIAATAATCSYCAKAAGGTPPLDHCGIAGVCRSWALRAFAAGERRLSRDDVETADAVVLSNAVRGILPVARLGDRTWSPHPAVVEARRRLAAAHPAFDNIPNNVDKNEDAP